MLCFQRVSPCISFLPNIHFHQCAELQTSFPTPSDEPESKLNCRGCLLAPSLRRPAPCEGVDLKTCTESKVGGVSPQPCLLQIIVSYLPCEPWCYLDWPFPLQVTGCRSAGERGGGSMIRPDQNCRVWCSLYRCRTHQTVRCPHQVWRSSRTHRDWRWRVTQSFTPPFLLCLHCPSDLWACLHPIVGVCTSVSVCRWVGV